MKNFQTNLPCNKVSTLSQIILSKTLIIKLAIALSK